jgi:predicted membrane-bound dolichyl-phosphate-mannose-protein mannosyltransferase
VLAWVLALSLLARGAGLGEPCRQPCRSGRAHVLIFDEIYYVNAARVIDGLRPPAGQPYAGAPLGTDPNAEHPQLVKLIIAGAIDLLGDSPVAWRLGSLLFGTLALLGVFMLARAAGAARPVALVASAVMALDNLTLVAGRIGTLDVYALAAMVWGVALFLRGRPLWAGTIVAVGGAMKEVALLALLVLALLEVLPGAPRAGVRALGACWLWALAGFVVLLGGMGLIARPYDASHATLLSLDPLAHVRHILAYGARQVSLHGPRGIASYPWDWLLDMRAITYLAIVPGHPSPGLVGVRPAVHFLGVISPPILVLGLPALLWAAGRRRWRTRGLLPLAWAWFLGTWGPLALAALVGHRTSYLYYMVIVMPALYLACAQALAALPGRGRFLRGLGAVWVTALVVSAVLLYPLAPAL